MGWSTREIAELSGTSLRAVRHYHEVGLLAEPERRSNGYKQYGVTHLVRLLRIKRLTDLGFSLAQITEMGDDEDHPTEALEGLDAELAATIERLQQVREELARILRDGAPATLPAEIAAAGDTPMSDADRSLAIVTTQLLDPDRRQLYGDMLQQVPRNPLDDEFDELAADADDATRDDLVERMVPYISGFLTDHPGMAQIYADAPGGARKTARTVGQAVRELYNPAQIEVMTRIGARLAELREAETGRSGPA